jgi:hypothetical protein
VGPRRGTAALRIWHSSTGDDVWVPFKLQQQVDVLERLPDVAMVNGRYATARDGIQDQPRRAFEDRSMTRVFS